MSDFERVLVATDLVDSTAMVAALGTARSADVWARHDRLARDLLRAHQGREIDRTDGFLLLFERPIHAIAWTDAYHEALAELSRSEALPITARAGIHRQEVSLRQTPAEDVARGAKPIEIDGSSRAVVTRILSLATGGTTVLSDGVARALAAEASGHRLADLGTWRLRECAEPVGLLEIVVDGRDPVPPVDTRGAWRVRWDGQFWRPHREVPNNLPAERDRFVGRDGEIEELSRRLDEGARVLTLLGTGGVGKTRLARRFAWTRLGDIEGGAWWVDLVECRSANDVVACVARVLQIGTDGDDPVGRVGSALAALGPAVVVLDNFEQVARNAQATLGRWLDLSPKLTFVVTSREVLGLRGEHVLALDVLTAEAAHALFVERAAAAHRTFVLTEANRPAIDTLVELLDRLPLAIELAAARVRVMTPAELVRRMSDRFRLLAGTGGRGTRQDTMRAVIDWSWALLPPVERAAVAQLSVFLGGFSLADAEAVLDLSRWPDAPWAADLVQSLVDRSLVRGWRSENQDEPRFGFYVSIHEYAAGRLLQENADEGTGAVEARAVADRHAAWFADRYPPAWLEGLDRDGAPALAAQLMLDRENLDRAVQHLVPEHPDAAARAMLALAPTLDAMPLPFVVARVRDVLAARPAAPLDLALRAVVYRAMYRVSTGVARHAELDEAFDRAADLSPPELARLWGLRAQVFAEQGRREEAAAAAEKALSLAEHAPAEARARVVGLVALIDDDPRPKLELAAALYEQVGNVRELGRTLGNLSAQVKHHDRDLAIELARRAVDLHRRVDNRLAEAIELGNLGAMLCFRSEPAEGMRLLELALVLHRRLGNRRSEGIVLNNLVEQVRGEGDHADVERLTAEALAIHVEVGNVRSEAFAWRTLGTSRLAQRDFAGAASALEAALTKFSATNLALTDRATTIGLLAEALALGGRVADAHAWLDAADLTGQAPWLGVELAMRRLVVDREGGASDLEERFSALRHQVATVSGAGHLNGDIEKFEAVAQARTEPDT